MKIEQGKIAEGEHAYPLRVYYEDTDAGGVVYHSRYLHFAERARTEMLRCMGLPHSELMKIHGVAFVVRGLTADYLRPAKLDDALMVRTKVLKLGAASIKMSQLIVFMDRDDAESITARLVVRLAAVNMDGKPTRLPPAFVDKARSLLEQEI